MVLQLGLVYFGENKLITKKKSTFFTIVSVSDGITEL